jgi:hypothetical protein
MIFAVRVANLSKDNNCIVLSQLNVAKRYNFNENKLSTWLYIAVNLIVKLSGPIIGFHPIPKPQ